jgi:hypothetical protein
MTVPIVKTAMESDEASVIDALKLALLSIVTNTKSKILL